MFSVMVFDTNGTNGAHCLSASARLTRPARLTRRSLINPRRLAPGAVIHPSSFTLIYDHVQIPTPVLQPQFLVLAKLQLSAALLRVGVFSFGGGVFVFLFSVFCCCFLGGVGVSFVVLGVLGGVWGAKSGAQRS